MVRDFAWVHLTLWDSELVKNLSTAETNNLAGEMLWVVTLVPDLLWV
jgi:hypothetical protein